jgi:Ulp1 family protease
MSSGRVLKVFAIVSMTEHWGALHVDVVNRAISFGDSLNRRTPDDAIEAVRKWLEITGQDLKLWSTSCGKFDVPRQPPVSGSCGINAANTIERVLNPGIERWTHSRSTYHRLRFLKLLTGYSKVRIGGLRK